MGQGRLPERDGGPNLSASIELPIALDLAIPSFQVVSGTTKDFVLLAETMDVDGEDISTVLRGM